MASTGKMAKCSNGQQCNGMVRKWGDLEEMGILTICTMQGVEEGFMAHESGSNAGAFIQCQGHEWQKLKNGTVVLFLLLAIDNNCASTRFMHGRGVWRCYGHLRWLMIIVA